LAAADKLQHGIWKDLVQIFKIRLGTGPLKIKKNNTDAAAATPAVVLHQQVSSQRFMGSFSWPPPTNCRTASGKILSRSSK
jgi:hypothetical protein